MIGLCRKVQHRALRCLFALTCLLFSVTTPAFEADFSGEGIAERVTSLRSITYYDYGRTWEQFEIGHFREALDGIQKLGGNAVWLVLPWKDFQPVALPEPQWNETALANVKTAVAEVEGRGMTVILPLCYLGAGWEPEGIDAHIWTLDDTMYTAFSTYAQAFIARLSEHGNILYLLYTEGCEPYIDKVRDYPIAIDSFRAWAQAVNPDLAYWNARWETKFESWESVLPIGVTVKDRNQGRYDDHWRWCAAVLRERHGPLARTIREQIKGRALLGYHDYSLIAQDWARGESPIPEDVPYDFLSTAGYYGLSHKSFEAYKTELLELIDRCRERYPQLPFSMLETGAACYEVGWQGQADAMQFVFDQIGKQPFGVNFWMYQDFECPELSQASFGLITPQGRRKYSYKVVQDAWAAYAPAKASTDK